MQVWVVTSERGYADYFEFRGVFSSLEKAKAWVETRHAHSGEPITWHTVRDGAVWLYDDYCLYRATVDGEIG